MAEPIDMIFPILQKIQTDISDLKDSVKSIDGRVGRLEVRVESIDNTMTYALGLNARTKADIDALRRRMDAVETELRSH